MHLLQVMVGRVGNPDPMAGADALDNGVRAVPLSNERPHGDFPYHLSAHGLAGSSPVPKIARATTMIFGH
jgi:hypothetical protein